METYIQIETMHTNTSYDVKVVNKEIKKKRNKTGLKLAQINKRLNTTNRTKTKSTA